MELRPGVHRIVAPLGDRFVALHLLIGPAGALLVDTGIRDSITQTFLPYLDANGIDRASVRWAINSHCDYDHTGGNGALKAAIPGVELLVHELDRDFTEDVQALIDGRYGEFRDADGFDDPPETTAYLRSVSDLVPVDRTVSGGEWIDLGDRRVQILHVPGHSPGHIAVHDPANATLVIGDATLGTTVPFADGRPAFPPTYRDVDPYVESIRTFRSLGATLLLTAHYPVYADDAVEGFLAESEAYTEQIDDVIVRELTAAGRPITTLELIRGAGAGLGPWGADALDYSIFPVTGNLERMLRDGAVRSETIDGIRHWSIEDAR
jgi:glyoxylase-like metal-dependent hydrolase (beta-lactamase superfamily II)